MMNKDFQPGDISAQTPARASAVLFVSTLASRLLGFVREMLMAYFFGASAITDAFMVAHTIPNLFRNALGNSFNSCIIPTLIHGREAHGEKEMQRSLSKILSNLTIIFVVLTILVFVLSGTIVKLIAPSLPPSTHDITVKILRILAFTSFIIVFIPIVSGVYQSYRHYLIPGFSRLLLNVGAISIMAATWKSLGIYSLVIGLTVGNLLHLLFMVYKFDWKFFSFRPGFRDEGFRALIKMFFPLLITVSFGQINIIVDRILASGLPEGNISALGYAFRVISLPLNLIIGSISAMVLPYFSIKVSENRLDDFFAFFTKSLRMSLFLALPFFAVLVSMNRELVQAIYQRGSFDAADTSLTATVLFFYAFAFFAQIPHSILTRAFNSFKDTATPMKISILTIMENIVLSIILVRRMGAPGLALATAIAYNTNLLLMLTLFFRKKIHGYSIVTLWPFIMKTTGLIILSTWVMILLRNSLTVNWASPWNVIVKLVVAGSAGMIVYIAGSRLLKIEELNTILERLKGRLK